jgi:hypothetical protein
MAFMFQSSGKVRLNVLEPEFFLHKTTAFLEICHKIKTFSCYIYERTDVRYIKEWNLAGTQARLKLKFSFIHRVRCNEQDK